MIHYIGIIGTRGDVYKENLFYTKELYEKLLLICKNYIESLQYENSNVCLVSGGCSFCDHLVVTLYNQAKIDNNPYHSLIIYSPCLWDSDHQRYVTRSESYNVYTGDILNKLHNTFSKRLGRDSLLEIDDVIKQSNVIFEDSSRSFKSRNMKIANMCKDVLIAFGWKECIDELYTSGTKITWDLARNTKVKRYINIRDLL